MTRPDNETTAASMAHDIWSRWMKHYFTLKDPSEHYERWINLMHRSFEQLTEKERESDYKVSEALSLALQSKDEEWRGKVEAVVGLMEIAKSKVGEHFHTPTEHRGCGACINQDINQRLDNLIAAAKNAAGEGEGK